MEIKGKLVYVSELQSPTPTFSFREAWVETEGQYPQTIAIQFANAKANDIVNIPIGSNLIVSINISGRIVNLKDGTKKVFNSINGWKIDGYTPVNTTTTYSPIPNAPMPNASDDFYKIPF